MKSRPSIKRSNVKRYLRFLRRIEHCFLQWFSWNYETYWRFGRTSQPIISFLFSLFSSAKTRLAISPEGKTLKSLQASHTRDKDSGKWSPSVMEWTVLQTGLGTTYFTHFIRPVQNRGFDMLMLNIILKTWAGLVIIVCKVFTVLWTL